MSEPSKETKKRVTNRDFIDDSAFKKACEAAGVTPSLRQASKFKNQRGLAYQRHQDMSIAERLIHRG